MGRREDEYRSYTRRDSLRLRGFDYAARQVYFITVVASDRAAVFLDRRIAQATLDCLFALRERMAFNLYCYCLMPDHIHALIGAGDSNKSLGEIVGAFKSLSTRAYWQWHQGKLWQRQFFDHVIRNDKEFYETIEYIKLNPVRKELVKAAADWPYTGYIDELQ